MKLIRIAKVEIYPYSEDDEFDEFDEDTGIDMYEAHDQVSQIFDNSQIRPSSTKKLIDIAILNGEVVGGVYASWNLDDNDFPEEEMARAYFDFDVAVKPEARGHDKVGIHLIDSAISKFESERVEYEEMGHHTAIKVWVVNPRLKEFLENRRGFSVFSDYGDGTAQMVKW